MRTVRRGRELFIQCGTNTIRAQAQFAAMNLYRQRRARLR